jgi:hypothetical protein
VYHPPLNTVFHCSVPEVSGGVLADPEIRTRDHLDGDGRDEQGAEDRHRRPEPGRLQSSLRMSGKSPSGADISVWSQSYDFELQRQRYKNLRRNYVIAWRVFIIKMNFSLKTT